MSQKRQLIGDAMLYAVASIGAQLLTLVAGILTRRFLGPVQTGVWSLLQVLLVYSAYSPLGVTEAVSREIPYRLGKGDEKEADRIKDLVYTFSSLTSGLLALGCILYALIRRQALMPEFFWGLLFTSAMILLQRTSNLRIAFLRGYQLFSIASSQMLWSALVNAILVALLSFRYQVYGFLAAMCLSFAFNALYVDWHHRFRFRWRWEWAGIAALIRYGFPLVLISMISAIFSTIDKMMIASFLGLREVGLYSIAIMAYSYLAGLPNAVGIVLIPALHKRFGESERIEDLRSYVDGSCRAFTRLMPPLIGISWFAVPYACRLLLPDFTDSLEPTRFLILGAYFVALIHPYSYFLVVIRKQMLIVPVLLATCILAVLFNLWAIRAGWGLAGVSLATTAVLGVKLFILFALSSRYLYSPSEAARKLMSYAVPAAGTFLLPFIVTQKMPGTQTSLPGTLVAMAIVLLPYVPGIVRLGRDLGIWQRIREKLQMGLRGSPR